jgi:subtilisin family serine protease
MRGGNDAVATTRGRALAARKVGAALLTAGLVMGLGCEPDGGSGGQGGAGADVPTLDGIGEIAYEQLPGIPIIEPEARERVEAGEEVEVVLVVDDGMVDDELTQMTGRYDRAGDGPDLVSYRARRQQELVSEALASMPATAAVVQQRFENLPVAVMTVSAQEALDALALHPTTLRVETVKEFEPSLAASLPLIGQPAAAAAGMTGAGTTVAVLDTGTEFTRAAFGPCTAPGVPANTCKVSFAQDFGTSDGMADDSSKHGTNVSAIVLGVAPNAKVAALDVFGSGGKASSTSILAAIDWVIANRAARNIVAMNLSLGGGSFTAPCPNDALAVGIATARTHGILSAVATGNDGFINAVATPACGPAAISVGAVYSANYGALGWAGCTDFTTAPDKVTCFSNSASFITMVAPGALITAGGETKGGTSMAAPHVAGAIAVLRAAYPADTLDQTVQRLTSGGPSITDARNGIAKPRLSLEAAAANCSPSVSTNSVTIPQTGGSGTVSVTVAAACGWSATTTANWLTLSAASGSGNATVTLQAAANLGENRTATVSIAGSTVTVSQAGSLTPPTLAINNGATITNNSTVTLNVSGNTAPYSQMCISNTDVCSTWVTTATQSTWKLSTGNGSKTVFARFRTASGTTLPEPVTASITLDATAPTTGTFTATRGVASVSLAWSGFNDADSGISKFRVVFATGTFPASCAAGVSVHDAAGSSVTHTGLTNGTAYFYRICAVDAAGNFSNGVTATATPVAEVNPPVGTVVINSGAAAVKTSTVTLTLSATDASTVSKMCVSNTATCASWQNYTTSRTWSLVSGNGTRTVFAYFQDSLGNTSEAVTDTIIVDNAVPTNGTLSAVRGDGKVTLSWTGFNDTGSGIASYRLVSLVGTKAPANCNTGTTLYNGTATSFEHTGLTNGTKISYRVCAIDNVALMSTGATITTAATPETTAPTGTLNIAGNAVVTKDLKVTLELSATDASGVTRMCVSNTATCTAWRTYATSLVWTLSSGSGAKTVHVTYEDTWGNLSPVYTDTITLDITPPTHTGFTATAGSKSVALSWGAATDPLSGLSGYKVVFGTGSTTPSSCSVGTVAYTGTATTFNHTGLTSGTVYNYRLCANDAAGNASKGLTAKATAGN